jgi:hypothetical protein
MFVLLFYYQTSSKLRSEVILGELLTVLMASKRMNIRGWSKINDD